MTEPDLLSGEPRLTEREALLNLRTVLRLCAAGELRCSPTTGRPSAATVQLVAASLAHGDFYPDDPIASFAWPLLLQAGGLATVGRGRLQLTAKGSAALQKPPADVIGQLWRRWLTHAVIDELSRFEQLKGQRGANVLTAAKTRRNTVATALAECPAGDWLDVESLFRAMRRKGLSPTIARSERALWRLYFCEAEYGSLGYAGFHDWEILEGRYTLTVLFEYASTLGLIDVDYQHPAGARSDYQNNWGVDDLVALTRYDGLRAIRLNGLGSYVLGLTASYQAPEEEAAAQSLKVLPNLDVVATGTVAAAEVMVLNAFAEQTADRVWTVSAASLLRAASSGRDLAEFTSFLAERSDHELPGSLTTLIGDLIRRAGQLADLGHVRLIECADAAVAALVAGDRTPRRLCRPVGDRHLAVPLEQEPKFRTALLKLGYALPR
jgi:Helicase conserved C-terminal domain